MTATTQDLVTARPGPRAAGRVAQAAALTCGLGWVGKGLLIAADGGQDTDQALVAVGWALGMLGLLVTGSALGFIAGRRLGRVPAVVGAVVAVPVAFEVQDAVDSVAKAVYDGGGWVNDELGLLILGGGCLLGGLLSLRGRRAS